jgi:hypothetical protein
VDDAWPAPPPPPDPSHNAKEGNPPPHTHKRRRSSSPTFPEVVAQPSPHIPAPIASGLLSPIGWPKIMPGIAPAVRPNAPNKSKSAATSPPRPPSTATFGQPSHLGPTSMPPPCRQRSEATPPRPRTPTRSTAAKCAALSNIFSGLGSS